MKLGGRPPMALLALLDFVGLDSPEAIVDALYAASGDAGPPPPGLMVEMSAEENLAARASPSSTTTA